MIPVILAVVWVGSVLVAYFLGKRRAVQAINSEFEKSIKIFLAQMGGDSHEGGE